MLRTPDKHETLIQCFITAIKQHWTNVSCAPGCLVYIIHCVDNWLDQVNFGDYCYRRLLGALSNPTNTKTFVYHLYNVGPTSLTLVRHCANVIQMLCVYWECCRFFNPFKPEFPIVIFIHCKPRIAVAILDLQWMKMTWCGWQMKKKMLLLKNVRVNFRSKPLGLLKFSNSSDKQNDPWMHREVLTL